MGSSCSVPCRPVDPNVALELRRADSPDPVMYDLMRKSIQATTQQSYPTAAAATATDPYSEKTFAANETFTTTATATTTTPKQQHRRKPVGQHHLLFRHANNSSKSNIDGTLLVDPMAFPTLDPVSASATAAAAATVPSSSSSNITPHSSGAKGVVDNWLPEDTTINVLNHRSCPTRLVIRRRAASSSVSTTTPHHSSSPPPAAAADGITTETHIYAIRYPEGTPDQVISEQAIPRPESARRQEQCPTTTPLPPPPATKAVVVDTTTMKPTNAGVASSSATTVDSTAVVVPPNSVVIRHNLSGGVDVYSPIAMGTRPRQEGRYSRKCPFSFCTVSLAGLANTYLIDIILCLLS